jgi:cell fate (sporulation/competence/biofilm development) regulator YlbF (YheA/YmcA/DUF963 family)
MAVRRHRNDTATYRELANHKERVQSFNMSVNLLYEYVRVQLELDETARRSPSRIVAARVETLRKVINRINQMI